jgi:hypothetical protein
MKPQPNLEEIKSKLPATHKQLMLIFPQTSARGLRNKLNDYVRTRLLFAQNNYEGKKGKPELIYTTEQPLIDEGIQELIKLNGCFNEALQVYKTPECRKKLIKIYQSLGKLLLENKL